MHLLLTRCLWLAATIAAVLAVGTVGYVWIDHAQVFDAFYMAVLTMATVGYGETIPLSRAGRVFNSVYILFSTSLLIVGMGVLTTSMFEMQFAELLGRRKVKRMIDKLSQHYIVCGLGRVGRGAAEELQRAGVPFVIVDQDEQRLAWAAAQKMLLLPGDATRDETLRQAGIDRARGIVCALASDADNLFLTLSAKSLNSRLMISARANERETEMKLRRAGADSVVAPYNHTGARLAQSILRPHVSEFLDFTTGGLGPNVGIEQVSVAEHFQARTLQDLHIRRELGIMVLAIRRASGEMDLNPGPDHAVHGGDHLIVMGETIGLRKLERMLAGGAV
jgi:voltage-gated potassium channel